MKRSEEAKAVADPVIKEIEDVKRDITQMESKINDHIKAMEEHETDIKDLNQSKREIENEILGLENEIRLTKIIVRRPISIPLLNLKNIFSKHKQKSEEVSKKREESHKKALKMKTLIKKKK